MEKAFEIQKQARDNVKTLQTYLTDLQNWETEMKRKEAALNGEFEQDLPPVRSKIKKEKPLAVRKKPEKRIQSSDYKAWEKFDVDKACEEVDTAEIGPTSLDSKKSMDAKKEKLREEAQFEKERGNVFVKQEKWDEAIGCYNRAIELVKDDAIYYANRGLCHLMKDNLRQAILDCNEALNLDPTYVKALQRRATANERQGSLRAASHDLLEVIRLEPHNAAARRQLEVIKKRMGTKGTKTKSSPKTTPVTETKPIVTSTDRQPKILELPSEPKRELTDLEKWKEGIGEGITVIKPVKKPPHLRSRRALKNIQIQEIPLGRTNIDKIIPIEMDVNKRENVVHNKDDMCKGDFVSPESVKFLTDVLDSEKSKTLTPPQNSVQFMSEWKYLKSKASARGDYLSIIEPAKIPSIFANALESNVLSEILNTLHNDMDKFKEKTISAYLTALPRVKRFSTLTLFLSKNDKDLLANLLLHCKTHENMSDNEIAVLKEKYEL